MQVVVYGIRTIRVESQGSVLVFDRKGNELAQAFRETVWLGIAEIGGNQRAICEGLRGKDCRQRQ